MSRADDDDLGADDAQLRAMRTVWLSMRDEEPSGRGMADLMAAARSQVAARQPEPAWKRAFAAFAEMLRRPPVLALATVVLVAGTAVLVHNHGGMAQDEAPAASPPMTVTMPGSAAPAAPAGAAMLGQAADRSAVVPEVPSPTAAPTPQPTPQTQPSPVVTAALPAAHTSSAAVARGPAPSPKAAPKSADMPTTGAGFGGKAAKPAMNEIATDADGKLEETETSVNQQPAPKPSPPAPPPVKIVSKAPMAPEPSPDPSDAPDAQAPAEQPKAKQTNDQLLRECEAAAARNDCAAVQAIAARLRTQDPAFYRSTVTRDGALAKCLPASSKQ